MEEITKRVPPQSLAAEQGIISSIFHDNNAFRKTALIIQSEDFYHPDLKIIYECIEHLIKTGFSVDMITVVEKLKEMGMLDQVGGSEYLMKLSVMTDDGSHKVSDYAQIVRTKSYLRKAIKYGQEVIATAYDNQYDETLSVMMNQPNISVKGAVHHKTSELMRKNLTDVATRYKAADDIRGMRTGFDDLDDLVGGIKGAETIALFAESNAGKSLMASDISRHIAKNYGKVAFFAYEMLGESITYRMMPDEMCLSIDDFNNPKKNLNQSKMQSIKQYDESRLDNIEIFAEELVMKTAAEVDSYLSCIDGLKLFVIDYLHLMKPMEAARNDIDKYTNVLRELNAVKIKHRVPMLLLMSQTKDGGFRGTEELRHDVDQMWELRRNGNSSDPKIRQTAKLAIIKGRDNKKGAVKLCYNEDRLTFKNASRM